MTRHRGDDQEPQRMHLSKAGALNTAIGFLAAVLTFLMLALIASKFGGSAGSDAYFFMLSLATVGTALVGGVFSAVLLPQFVEARIKGGMTEAGELASQLLGWLVLLCLLLVGALVVFHDAFYAIASRFSWEQIQAQSGILGWLGPVLFFSVLSEYLRLLLLGSGRYVISALMALVTPSVLVGVLLLDATVREESLALALALSRFLMFVGALAVLLRSGMVLRPRLLGKAPVAKFVRVSAPYAAASLVTHSSVFFFDYMASGLGAGVLTAVTLAHRVFALPLMLLVTPLLEIARVRFAEYRAQEDQEAFRTQYEHLSVLVLYLALPVGVLFFMFPQEIISLLFQRGAFTAQDAMVAADCLRVLAWSVPLACFFTLNGRVVESFQQLDLPAFLGSIGNLSLMALTFGLVGAMGYIGIPLARLAVDLCYLLPLGLWMLHHHQVRVDYAQLLVALCRSAVSCAIPVGVALMLRAMFVTPASPVTFVWALIAVAAMGGLYTALVLVLEPRARVIAKAIMGKI